MRMPGFCSMYSSYSPASSHPKGTNRPRSRVTVPSSPPPPPPPQPAASSEAASAAPSAVLRLRETVIGPPDRFPNDLVRGYVVGVKALSRPDARRVGGTTSTCQVGVRRRPADRAGPLGGVHHGSAHRPEEAP